jgi:hypothetical protein
MLKSLEFGVWTQELHYAACTCASGLIVCNFFLLINMVGVASRNLGWGCGWVQAHYYCKWAKSFDIGFNSLTATIANGQSLLILVSVPLAVYAIVVCLLPNAFFP